MNVYDFDKTIYNGDSATHFWRHCIARYPAALSVLPGIAWTAVSHLHDPEIHGAVKERMFAILRFVPDAEEEAKLFWDRHMDGILPWYHRQKREDDLIISASPAFLIGEIASRLGVRCIATEMDPRTGRLNSPNCRGRAKVERFRAACGNETVEEFYSDSFADRPMMEIANSAFLMKKGKIVSRIR